jgi:hypothetical protein
VFALVEVLLSAAAAAFDLFRPKIVILFLASISLAIPPHRTGLAWLSAGLAAGRMVLAVFVLTVGWSLVRAFVLIPIDGGQRTRFLFRSRWDTAPWWFTLAAGSSPFR